MANRFEQSKNAQRAAHHEAGHAVVDILFGLPFESISMEVKQKPGVQFENGKEIDVTLIYTEGIVWPKERTDMVNKNLLAGVLDLREAIASMAGPVAEKIYVGKPDEKLQTSAEMDITPIMACCRAAISGSGDPGDWKEIRDMEVPIVNAIAAGAEQVVRMHWNVIRAVAKAIQQQQNMDYEEVLQIVKNRSINGSGGRLSPS